MQYLVEKVELFLDKEQLTFHLRSVDDCRRLWAQLYGQLLDVTEGRKAIPYEIQVDIPDADTLDIFIYSDQIPNVLTHLEVECEFYKILAPGTTAEVMKQLEVNKKPTAREDTHKELDDSDQRFVLK